MNEDICKECGGEVEIGEICRFCGAFPEGFENCGTNPVNIRYSREGGRPRRYVNNIDCTAAIDITDIGTQRR